MTDNEKMMLPLKILSDLSLNAGTIDIEELMKDKSEEDKEYIKEVAEDLENAGYIEINETKKNELEECYPEIYKIVYPMICKSCLYVTEEITPELVEKITNEIY